jgi:hypothetical protein
MTFIVGCVGCHLVINNPSAWANSTSFSAMAAMTLSARVSAPSVRETAASMRVSACSRVLRSAARQEGLQ